MPYIDMRTVKPKKLPEKKPGRHRFIMMATFTTSEEAVKHAYEGTDVVLFDQENIWDVAFGCIDCEEPYTPKLRRFCPAPEYIPPEERG